MSTFVEPHKDLGRVHSGSKNTLSYKFEDTMTIVRVDTSCGCTLGEVDNAEKIVILVFNAPDVPKHLVDAKGKGGYKTTKSATIFYNDSRFPGEEHQEIITFKANVYQ